MNDLFKVVIMLKDATLYKRMNAVRTDYFRKDQPISTCFQAPLIRSDILVEIEAVALITKETTGAPDPHTKP